MKVFSLRSSINLPFDTFKNLGSISGKLTKHMAWELEHTYYSGTLYDIDISWSIREDHAGFELVLGLFGYGVHFHIYDTRHWDYARGEWTVYG